jgi:hypothetical protein
MEQMKCQLLSNLSRRNYQADCTYQVVLLSGTRMVLVAVAVLTGCTVPLGAFDTSGIVFDAIGNDELAFSCAEWLT